jgi:hypothetical protein
MKAKRVPLSFQKWMRDIPTLIQGASTNLCFRYLAFLVNVKMHMGELNNGENFNVKMNDVSIDFHLCGKGEMFHNEKVIKGSEDT